jgi:hypothetical protein
VRLNWGKEANNDGENLKKILDSLKVISTTSNRGRKEK